VRGINNAKNPEAVVEAVAKADLVTTAIGPNILPFIAELIAKGIEQRRVSGNTTPVDVDTIKLHIAQEMREEFQFSKNKDFSELKFDDF